MLHIKQLELSLQHIFEYYYFPNFGHILGNIDALNRRSQ